MAYRCGQAVFGGAREAIRCRVSGTVCAHQKMCMMEGRTVLTDGAMRCPARDGRMPEEERAEGKAVQAEVTTVDRVPEAAAAKAARTRKTAQKSAKTEPAKKTARTARKKS